MSHIDDEFDGQKIHEAMETLRAWTKGDLRHDEQTTPIRFAPAPCGRLVVSVSNDMLQAIDCALAIPEELSPAMELAVTMEPFDAIGGSESNSDRWKIYHGTPPCGRWALLSIDMARFHGHIIDGDALQVPNPLAGVEPRICGLLNREHQTLMQERLQRTLNLDAESPRVVGVDPLGLDLRNRFDIVRLSFPEPITEVGQAESAILSFIST